MTVFSAHAVRTHEQHTLQSFKNTFLSRNLDQNMLKNALFFEKVWKIAAALGTPPPNPRWPLAEPPYLRVVSPFTCHSYFLEGACSGNVIIVKKKQEELRNSNNVLVLPFFSYFKLCAGYPNKRHWLRFLGIVTIKLRPILYHT